MKEISGNTSAMATAKKPRKKSKNNRAIAVLGQKFSWWVWALVSTVVLIIVLQMLWVAVGHKFVGKIQMEHYLKAKYGQEFVIKSVDLNKPLGNSGWLRGEAYPLSDHQLKFTITKPEFSISDSNTTDTFLQELWSKQGRNEVAKFIAGNLSPVDSYHLIIRPSNALYKSIRGTTPSYDMVKQNHSHELGYSLSVKSTVSIYDDEPTNDQLERAYKVVRFVQGKSAADPEAYYLYRDAKFPSNYQYSIQANRKTIGNINSPGDLLDQFMLIN